MARERLLFSEGLKDEAVKLVGPLGASKAAIARDLGVGTNLLRRGARGRRQRRGRSRAQEGIGPGI